MVYCAGKPMENSRVLEESVEESVNHSPTARDLQILLVFYQHLAWFISL